MEQHNFSSDPKSFDVKQTGIIWWCRNSPWFAASLFLSVFTLCSTVNSLQAIQTLFHRRYLVNKSKTGHFQDAAGFPTNLTNSLASTKLEYFFTQYIKGKWTQKVFSGCHVVCTEQWDNYLAISLLLHSDFISLDLKIIFIPWRYRKLFPVHRIVQKI